MSLFAITFIQVINGLILIGDAAEHEIAIGWTSFTFPSKFQLICEAKSGEPRDPPEVSLTGGLPTNTIWSITDDNTILRQDPIAHCTGGSSPAVARSDGSTNLDRHIGLSGVTDAHRPFVHVTNSTWTTKAPAT